jgi:hypothetical protein
LDTSDRLDESREGEAVSDEDEYVQVAQDEQDLGTAHAPAEAELTGHAAVDEVLGSLERLEGRPVTEHVAVFEAAHEALRVALADAGDRPGNAAP